MSVSYITVSGSGSTLDSTPIESTDVGEYITAYVVTSVSPANGAAVTVTGIFECSNDNSTWFQVPALVPATPIAPTEILSFLYFVQGSSAASDTLYKVRLSGRYFRFRLNFYDGAGSTVTANAYIIAADNQDAEVMTASRIVDYFGNYASVGQDTMSASLSVTIASDQTPIPVTQSGTWVLGANSGVDIGDVTVNNAAGAAAVNIQDGGNSITVDGTLATTQSGTWVLGANSGVDIGDVTVNNAAGAAAVNIQDGGNSITVDGTVAATQSGTWVLGANSGVDIGDVTVNNAAGAAAVNIQDGGNSITVDGTVTAAAQPGVDIGDVTVNNAAGAAAVNIQDGGNSITVDGTVTVSNFPTTLDTNYGAVGASTLRTAAQIGNATGAALFGAGTTTAQVLRVVLPTDQTVIPVQGQKTNNNAAPGATNVGVLPGVATAAAPSSTEGNQVALSLNLTGSQRVIDTAAGPVAPGTVAANSALVGGQFNTTLPTLTNTQQAALQVDSRGRLIVAPIGNLSRNKTNFFMAIQIVTTGTDALLSLTGYKSDAAVGATTTPAVVTAAKTYRIISVTMSYTTIVTTPGSVRFTLRANTGGTVVIGSPAVCNWEVGEPTGIAPVAGKKNTAHLAFPDGIEFAAGTGIGISQVGLNTVGAAAAVGYGQISIQGYEY